MKRDCKTFSVSGHGYFCINCNAPLTASYYPCHNCGITHEEANIKASELYPTKELMKKEEPKSKIIQICFSNNGSLYALDSDGNIFKRDEPVYGGDSWRKISNPIK